MYPNFSFAKYLHSIDVPSDLVANRLDILTGGGAPSLQDCTPNELLMLEVFGEDAINDNNAAQTVTFQEGE